MSEPRQHRALPPIPPPLPESPPQHSAYDYDRGYSNHGSGLIFNKEEASPKGNVGTLSSMLHAGGEDNAHDVSNEAARAAAAMVAASAVKVAAQNREASQAFKAAAVTNDMPSERLEVDGTGEMSASKWQPDPHHPSLKPPMKLWLPEPSQHEPQQSYQSYQAAAEEAYRERHAHAQEAAQNAGRSQSRRRSRSRKQQPQKSRSRSRKRNRRTGWDKDETPAPAPQARAMHVTFPTPSAPPSRPALPPGVTEVVPGGAQTWAGHVQVNRNGIPEATREALAAAVLRAQQVEAAGLASIRETGQIPRGPPDLPTGTEVIEQKCVAYLIGKGGQALGAISAAAGVSIQIDQSTKTFGWSMANIYGSEEGAVKAKMILRQKISEYRPLRL